MRPTKLVISKVSIHAPGRGATRGANDRYEQLDNVSIHAPGRGATTASDKGWTINYVSIHAPGRGATLTGHLA